MSAAATPSFMNGLTALWNALNLGFGNSNTNTNTSGQFNTNSSGTQTSQLNLTPFQSALQSPLYQYATALYNNPEAVVQPYEQAGADQINNSYNGLSQALAQQFLSTSGGSSGKFGMALAQGNLQRLGQLGANATSFGQTAATLPLQFSNLATNLLSLPFSTTTSGSSSSSGSQAGQTNSSTSGFGFGI